MLQWLAPLQHTWTVLISLGELPKNENRIKQNQNQKTDMYLGVELVGEDVGGVEGWKTGGKYGHISMLTCMKFSKTVEKLI